MRANCHRLVFEFPSLYFRVQSAIMPRDLTALSISNLAKYGHFEELHRRVAAGEDADLATVFERAATDFRTVKRNPGHLKILKWCVDQGLDYAARADWLNRPVVCLAAASGNNEVIKYMMDQNLPEDPFIWASVGEIDLLKQYASSHDLSGLSDANGFNLLFYCVESGLGRRDEELKQTLTSICRLLLAHNVCPRREVKFDLPICPAFLCAANGGNEEIMRLLLENGGLTAERFHLVMEHSLEPHQRSGEPFYAIANCILQYGFDINETRADQGRSLLHGAANRGTVKAVEWLLENGADPNGLDDQRRTPLHVSAQRNTFTAVVKLLVDSGCDPMAKDVSGMTALDCARDNKRTRVVEYLESSCRR